MTDWDKIYFYRRLAAFAILVLSLAWLIVHLKGIRKNTTFYFEGIGFMVLGTVLLIHSIVKDDASMETPSRKREVIKNDPFAKALRQEADRWMEKGQRYNLDVCHDLEGGYRITAAVMNPDGTRRYLEVFSHKEPMEGVKEVMAGLGLHRK